MVARKGKRKAVELKQSSEEPNGQGTGRVLRSKSAKHDPSPVPTSPPEMPPIVLSFRSSQCCICREDLHADASCMLDRCYHEMCRTCIEEWTEQQMTPLNVCETKQRTCTCPECRSPYSLYYTHIESETKYRVEAANVAPRPIQSVYQAMSRFIREYFKEQVTQQWALKKCQNDPSIRTVSDCPWIYESEHLKSIFDPISISLSNHASYNSTVLRIITLNIVSAHTIPETPFTFVDIRKYIVHQEIIKELVDRIVESWFQQSIIVASSTLESLLEPYQQNLESKIKHVYEYFTELVKSSLIIRQNRFFS